MVSRLDRLFILLDTGSSDSIRLAAAKQLGEVQRVQPDDLHYLLRRIKQYSGKSVWETRVASGQAIRCILEHLGEWPPPAIKTESDNDRPPQRPNEVDKIIEQNVNTIQILHDFDLTEIVSMYPPLLSMDILEAEEEAKTSRSTTGRGRSRKASTSRSARRPNKEHLLRQRQLINKELGISMVDSLNLGVKSTDIVTNDDLQNDFVDDNSQTKNLQQDAHKTLSERISHYKKVIKILLQATSIGKSEQERAEDTSRIVEWPLSEIVSEYEVDLFNPSWELRHGCAIALREIIRSQGKSAGKWSGFTQKANEQLNQLWLVDMALKALCVLGLDRFGDFLFDQVVAPVRENSAQLLGCCVAAMDSKNGTAVINILLKMLDSGSWEIRHGGILGLKYTLSVLDEKALHQTLSFSFDSIFKCLGDANDDVSAEAAASLVPVKDLLIEAVPDKTPKLIKFLWDHLADLDDLTSSTSNIVLLLASLITSNFAKLEPTDIVKSIPRLWPLLSHSSTSVRVSVLKALITLLKSQTTSCLNWMPDDLISTALRLLFQRSIIEDIDEVRPHIEDAWTELVRIDQDDFLADAEGSCLLKATSQYLNYWLCLTMQPSNACIDRGNPLWLDIRSDGTVSDTKPEGELYLASRTFNAETEDEQKSQVTKCRLLGTNLLGILYSNLVFRRNAAQSVLELLQYISDMFTYYLTTKSANQRMVSGWALEAWARHHLVKHARDPSRLSNILSDKLKNQLTSAIQDTSLCYDELATLFTRLQQEAREFVAAIVAASVVTNFPTSSDRRVIYNLSQIQSMCDMDIENELTRVASKRPANSDAVTHDVKSSPAYVSLQSKRSSLIRSYQTTRATQRSLSIATLSSLACALISWHHLPDTLKLLIDPLLDSIETETEIVIQNKSIDYLVNLIDILCLESQKNQSIIEGILSRLIASLYDSSSSLDFSGDASETRKNSVTDEVGTIDQYKILMLDNLQRKAEQTKSSMRRQSSASSANLKRSHSITSAIDNDGDLLRNSQRIQIMKTKELGVDLTLKKIVRNLGQDLPKKLPQLWLPATSQLKSQIELYSDTDCHKPGTLKKLISGLLLLQKVGENLSPNLRSELLAIYQDLITILTSSDSTLRHQSSQCIGMISKIMMEQTEGEIAAKIIPMLESDNTFARCGAMEALALIIEHLNLDLVPRINSLIVHVLRRMSDQNDQVRLMATHCFGKLLSLMPLNIEKVRIDSIKSEPKHIDGQVDFIEQLLHPKNLESFNLPFETQAELRSYQQEGLNWLAFLNRFNLHGILCDEMGLGKTFMTICMVAADHVNKDTSPTSADKQQLPSLIVCPPTLVEHWLCEIDKFVAPSVREMLNPLGYTGNANDRLQIRNKLLSAAEKETKRSTRLIITSYEALRNDVDFFKTIDWNYCVLDEGHIIKNGKTKLSRAVRLLTARHRLILSGTPIQNNVTELWSLFDFLMPGFLGSERQFNNFYAKRILQSREPKCSSKELEAGALAMESLHRQVLPFILRRLKEDVLDDLPPKIIQDYYCELSSLQRKLYEDFTHSKLCREVAQKSLNEFGKDEDKAKVDVKSGKSTSHVFQALQYLKNVCNHPKLVLTQKHSHYEDIKKSLDNDKQTLDDISHSSKLIALKQLLIDCGIGVSSQANDENQQQPQVEIESVVNQHRALVFCQLRSMVEIIENDLLKKHLPNATFLKLDGSIPPNQRQSIVSKFNNDPSIDLLLLTTQTGGLGLNLTGADTVIFVEHDWNPTRDLQAMDRAHRIGQKKVVNVYRLITKDTLEEKIMGLQKFKTMVSNTVINQDNSGLNTMNVDQLLDLFNVSPSESDSTGFSFKGESGSLWAKKASFIDLLPELWDQQQYETEYDLSNFVSSLKS